MNKCKRHIAELSLGRSASRGTIPLIDVKNRAPILYAIAVTSHSQKRRFRG